jgi:hypothetical protein
MLAAGVGAGVPFIGGTGAYWNVANLFFSRASYDAYGGGGKTLASAAVLTTLGITGSGGANGTVVDVSGNIVAATAPRLTCDRGAGQNGFTSSGDPTGTGWSSANVVTPVSVANKFGASTGWLLANNTTNDYHRTQQSVTLTAGTWCIGYKVAAAGLNYAGIAANGIGTQVFNLTAGTVGSASGVAGAGIVPISGGWFVWAAFTVGAGSTQFQFAGCPANSWSSTVGDNVSGIYAGDFQINPGSTPQAYLRTTTTAPLYTAGTPRSQNLILNSANLQTNVGNSNQVTATASTLTIGASASSAYYYIKTGALVANAVYSGRVIVTGPAGRIIGVRASDAVNGSGAVAQAVTCTGAAQTIDLLGMVPTNATGGLECGIENRTGTVATVNAQTGDVFTLTLVAVVEGSVIPPNGTPATTGTAYSEYPQAGLLREVGRTNSIRNSTMVGAAAGSPGTVPTNWVKQAASGMTFAVSATGTVDGRSYVDIRLSGTTGDTSGNVLKFEAAAGIAAVNAQVWSLATDIQLVSGALTNVSSVQLSADVNNSGGSYLSTATGTAVVPAYIIRTRSSASLTVNNASAAYINPYIIINPTGAGVAIDVTLRITSPQLELGAFPTSYIPTTTASVARSDDLIRPPTTYINDAAQTTAAECVPAEIVNGGCLLTRGGNYGGPVYINSGQGKIYDGSHGAIATGLAVGVLQRLATRYNAALGIGISANGAAAATAAFSGTMFSGTVALGDDGAGGNGFTGLVTRIAIKSSAANDSDLQAASAGTL